MESSFHRLVENNVDGAFDTQTQQGGLGFVIRDSAVSCLGGCDRPILHGNSADHTELLEAQLK